MNYLFLIQIRIAYRNIIRHRRRSMLTTLAVAFGIFCLIVFQALKIGLHEKMMESSLGLDLGAIQIHAAGYEVNMPLLQPIAKPANVVDVLTEMGLFNHAAMRVKGMGLVLAGPYSSSVVLSGIEPEKEKNVTFIHTKLVAGRYHFGNGSLLLGQALAESLDLRVGDSVNILAQNSFGQPARRQFTVSGLFESGLRSFDQTHVYVDIADARSLLETENDALTEIAIAFSPGKAASKARQLQARLEPSTYQVRSFEESAPDLVQLMALNDATFRLLILIVFTIVALGIANTMTTVIFERFRELGTLAAIGTTPLQIVTLIITESAILGGIASCIGSVAAIAACQWLAVHGIDLSHFTSSNQYFAAGALLHASLQWKDVVVANVVTLSTALAAGIYPALKAARLRPVEALRAT